MANNFQIMRAALLRVKEARGRDLEYVTLADIDADVDAALAAPPRNCDVGTPEEQARRFQLFCQAHRAFDAGCSSNCPFVDTADINHCQSGWAQLPYEGGRDAIS